jgi:hypothetical protein
LIGKIQRVPLREVWKHEALDFTTWLQNNLDVLNDVLDLDLVPAEREQSAGDFSVDLVAQDAAGNAIIIENQLEKSDHGHLGKVITYLTALEAKKAVWIVAEPRPEHVRAITWLNECGAASFYLAKLEGIRIGDSPPAPLLTLIVGPSDEGREVGETKKELAASGARQLRFWEGLLKAAKTKTKLHANVSPRAESWITAGSGKTGLNFNYTVRKHDAAVELYINRPDAINETKAIFDRLSDQRSSIESLFGGPLDWQRRDGRPGSRIEKRLALGGYLDEERWPDIHEGLAEAMARLEKALKPHIAQLQF